MRNEEMTTYTSPASGVTYMVAHTATYGWERWEILKDGRMVQFALTEAPAGTESQPVAKPAYLSPARPKNDLY
jgi:hypothetical protein